MNPSDQLLSACAYALQYFEFQHRAGNTYDEAVLDRLDEQMLTMEPEMIPMLRAAIAAATTCQASVGELQVQ